MKYGASVDTRSASPGESSAIVPLSLATVTVWGFRNGRAPRDVHGAQLEPARSVDRARRIPVPLVRRHGIDRA
jgi:hypothetical protein